MIILGLRITGLLERSCSMNFREYQETCKSTAVYKQSTRCPFRAQKYEGAAPTAPRTTKGHTKNDNEKQVEKQAQSAHQVLPDRGRQDPAIPDQRGIFACGLGTSHRNERPQRRQQQRFKGALRLNIPLMAALPGRQLTHAPQPPVGPARQGKENK